MSVTLLLYNLKLNFLMFFYQSNQLTGYIYTDIYCKLSKFIGQTSCSYEHYLVYCQAGLVDYIVNTVRPGNTCISGLSEGTHLWTREFVAVCYTKRTV